MDQDITSISRLFCYGGNVRAPVAIVENGEKDWEAFARDVGTLATRLTARGGDRWLVADADAYIMAVGILATLYANCTVVLPANLQPGHIADLSKTVDGVIAGSGDIPGAINALESAANAPPATLDGKGVKGSKIILHTSGTTGRPIAEVKPLRCLEAEIRALHETFGPFPEGVVLATVPPYHIYGLLFRILWPLATGRTFASGMIAYPEEMIAAVEKNPGSVLVSSPAFLRRALPVLDLDRMRKSAGPVYSSGGHLPEPTGAAYNAILRYPVTEVYGSTETGGIAFRRVLDAEAPPPWQALPDVEIDLDPEDKVLKVRSPFLPNSEWFQTSDRVALQSDGRFLLRGRADRIVKVEELRVSLTEIENRLQESDDVDIARAIPLAGSAGRRQVLGVVVEPSQRGWQRLSEAGRQSLRDTLRALLTPHVPAVGLPRRWRFVTRIPEDERGKATNAALAALFKKDQARETEPEVLKRTAEVNSLNLLLRLPDSLSYFQGHFDEAAILPGVVQIDWAAAYAKAQFNIPGGFQTIEALKFFKTLRAGDTVSLTLQHDADKARVAFAYSTTETKYSSGRIVFDAAP